MRSSFRSDRIYAFLAVAEELHFGRAADRVGVSQSTLTRLVRGCESDIGLKLFTRDSRNVNLTRAGEEFFGTARKLVRYVDMQYLNARRSQSRVPSLDVGYTGPASLQFIGDLLSTIRSSDIPLALNVDNTKFAIDALDGVLDGSLDAALLRLDRLPRGLSWVDVSVEDIGVAYNADVFNLGPGPVDLRSVAELPHVLMSSSGSSLTAVYLDLLDQAKHSIIAEHIVSDPWTAMAVCSAGGGVTPTTIPRPTFVDFPKLRVAPLLAGDKALKLRFAWRSDDRRDSLMNLVGIAAKMGNMGADWAVG